MINFEALPTQNPFSIPEPGLYKAVIEEAEMRTPKTDATKPDYLNLKLSLYKADGTKAGVVYDIISESEKSAVMFKLGRLLKACDIPLIGSLELRDLAKIIKGKEIGVDITHDKTSERPRAQVALFGGGVYYTLAEYHALVSKLQGDSLADDFVNDMGNESPFNAPDGEQATNSTVAGASY